MYYFIKKNINCGYSKTVSSTPIAYYFFKKKNLKILKKKIKKRKEKRRRVKSH
jgi:hypothetical protein